MKTLTMLGTVLSLVICVIFTVGCFQNGIELGKDIGAPLNRAQVAANPNDMDVFMAQVQKGMEDHNMTSGNWAIINQTVDSDFAVAYASVKSIRERIATIKGFEPTSVQYQVGLDDVRGTIRELHIGQQDQNVKEHLWVLIFYVAALICGILWLGRNWDDSYSFRKWRWSI